MRSAYEQYAANTLNVEADTLGSPSALIGTTVKARRSLALTCLGLIKTGSLLMGLVDVALRMLLFGFVPSSAGTYLLRSA